MRAEATCAALVVMVLCQVQGCPHLPRGLCGADRLPAILLRLVHCNPIISGWTAETVLGLGALRLCACSLECS